MPSKPTIWGELAAIFFIAALPAHAEMSNLVFLARAEQAVAAAQQNFSAAPNRVEAGWRLGSACFDVADLATNDAQREAFAKRGIAACNYALGRQTNCAAGHYYLAMNLGKLAEAEAPSLAAYRLVHEVEREFETAAALDVHFDYAGPARNLGELYFQAPSWPLSIGNKHKAREWLERAAALAPDYPENLLALAEARWKWHEHAEFAATMKQLESLWPAARTNFTGEAWESSWADWETRRAMLRAHPAE
jgi:tetratricopeptide (TPR) repeat protein